MYNMQSDLGQVKLICEIFRNNYKICIERSMEVLDDFRRLILSNGRQSKFLEIFEIVQIHKNDFILKNQ